MARRPEGVPQVPTAPGGRVRNPRLPRSARREQLLGAAREVFVASGYHAAAMDDIAERAGVSKPVLYQHFPGKLDLYLALLDESTEELQRDLLAALSGTSDNRQRVEASIAAYFEFVGRQDSAFRLLFESDLRNDPAVRERVERSVARSVAAIADAIAEDTGVGPLEARLLSVGLTGIAELGARWWIASATPIPKDDAVRLLAGLAWRGISGFPRTG